MGRVAYIPVLCKSALTRVHGMPFKWSLNPYSGCAHGCHYCYARAHYSLHAGRQRRPRPPEQPRLCGCNRPECPSCSAWADDVTAEHRGGARDFETRIFVKSNFVEVLRHELGRPSWRGEQVAVGTATDAYQPAEGRFRLTRRVLETLRDARNPLGMVTKSPLVVRDVDVLAGLARQAPVRVFFTITTLDQQLWRVLEPGTANPLYRLRALRTLREAGVPAGVFLAPILPGITDSAASIEAVAAAAAEHGASSFGTSTLRLAPVVKEHYLRFVGEEFPDLLPRYERAYPAAHAPREYEARLAERVERIRRRYGFAADSMRRRDLVPRADTPSSARLRAGVEQLQMPL